MAGRSSRILGILLVFFVLIGSSPLWVGAYIPPATATTTTVASSSGTITLGDTVTFTASVTASTGTPTGLVTFFDGNTPLGSGTLQVVAGNNQATFSTSLLSASASPHSITAIYQGDATHTASTSSAISETVNPRNSTTGVALSPTTVVVGQSSTAMVTLTDSGSMPPGSADSFTATGAPATGRTGFSSALFADGLVLVAGGTDASGTVLQTAEVYSVSGAAFSATGNLNAARTGAAGVLLPNGKVLVAGGSSDGTANGALNSAELFDPSAGTFSATSQNMNAARVGMIATLLPGGKILLAGGENSGGVLNSAELYDPVADTFTPTGNLNSARSGASATLLGTGNVLIAGGSSDATANGALNTAELFDPTGNSGAGTFTSITGANSTLAVQRWQPEAALLLSGKVLIAGGQNSGGALASADLYDPAGNTFTPSNGSMAQPRANGSAVPLPNGMVLLAGGTTSQAVDLYDADSNRFDTTGNLNQSDAGLIATLLNNGDVLVVGLTTAVTPASDAELYSPSFNPLGTVGVTSSVGTDSINGSCVLIPSNSTASTCTATITPANVASSPHTITGTYTADAVHSGGSNTANLAVTKADTTTIITANTPNPSPVNQPVTVNVQVTANPPGSGTPTGTVTVSDGVGQTCTTLSLDNTGAGSCSLIPVAAGTDTLTATYNGDTNFNTSTSAGVSQTVVAPPSISKAFNPTAIPLTATSTLTFTITNPAGNTVALTGVAFTDTLPTGLAVASSSSTVCGGTLTTTATTGITLSGATIAVSGQCQFSVTVTGAAAGSFTNTTGNVTATNAGGVTGNTGSATLTVVAPPSIAKAFNPTSIPLNATNTLTFTITNPAANTVALTGVAFTDTLPTGLTVANNTSTVCGGTLTTTAPAGIALSGAGIAVSGQCQFTVTVTGATAGSFTNISGNVTATNVGGITGNTATATLTVVAPPSMVKAFTPTSIPLNGTSTLTFTITNPVANTVALTGVAFTDTLPSGLTVANSSNPVCGGTLTTTSPTGITLAGATIAIGGQCQFNVIVTGAAPGSFTNTTGNVTATDAGGVTGNTATATLTVVAPPSITKGFIPATVVVNQTTTLTFTITNPTADTVGEAGVAFSDTLPTGLVVATPNGLTNSCGGTASATPGGTSISLTGGTIAVNSSCTVVVNVIGNLSGSFTNTSGAVSSTNGGTGTTATAAITVNTRQTNVTVNFSRNSSPITSVPIATPVTVTFTVTDTDTHGSALTPTGSVTTISSSVTGPNGDIFSSGTCTLNTPTSNANSCTVTLTAQHVATNPHAISALYVGSPIHSSGSGSGNITVNPAHTVTVIPSASSLQPDPAFSNQKVTFKGTVTNVDSGSIAAPVGSLQFLVDGNVIGTVALIPTSATSSSATFPANLSQIGPTPSSGSPVSHSITTNFVPNPDFQGNPSTNSTNLIGISFAPTITNIPGQAITPVTFPVNSTGTSGTISFQCTVLLLGSSTPSSHAPQCSITSTSNSVTVALSTSPNSSSMINSEPVLQAQNRPPLVFYSVSAPQAVVFGLLLVGKVKRKYWSRRRLLGVLGMMLLMSLLIFAAGCGGGFGNSNNLQPLGNGTASGQYVITVVGTDSTTNVVAVGTMQLTVQL